MKGFFSQRNGRGKMPHRVKVLTLRTEVSATVNIPSYINIDPDDEGNHWWIKWNTLYYREGGVVKEYDLGNLDYDGDYKRPDTNVEEDEEYAESIPEDIEEALEAWEAYQNKEEEHSAEWVEMMEHKIALYHETMAEIARGK